MTGINVVKDTFFYTELFNKVLYTFKCLKQHCFCALLFTPFISISISLFVTYEIICKIIDTNLIPFVDLNDDERYY